MSAPRHHFRQAAAAVERGDLVRATIELEQIPTSLTGPGAIAHVLRSAIERIADGDLDQARRAISLAAGQAPVPARPLVAALKKRVS